MSEEKAEYSDLEKAIKLLLKNSINFQQAAKVFASEYIFNDITYLYMYYFLINCIHQDTVRFNELSNMAYGKYLNSNEWKIKRKILIGLYGKCQLCGNKDMYNIHHNSYKNKPLEELADLLLLCDTCHSWYHDSKKHRVDLSYTE